MQLSPGPLHLLVAMSRGAPVRAAPGVGGEWYSIVRPGRDAERVHARAVNTLVRLGLVERREDVFRVAHSGWSWIAANLEKHSKSSVAEVHK